MRSQLDGSMEVVGEFATLAEARAAGEDVAVLVPELHVDLGLTSAEPLKPR